MEFRQVITERHSVRKFQDKHIDRSILDSIIDDANLAPSSKNTKSSGFMVIEDKSLLEALSEMRTSGSTFLKDAAAAIVVLGDTSKTDLWVDNASISTTYILLSAVDKGLGACWIHVNGRLRDKHDPTKGTAEQYVRELLGIKDEMSTLCIVALGYEQSPTEE